MRKYIPIYEVGMNVIQRGKRTSSAKKDLFWKEVKVGYFGYVIV